MSASTSTRGSAGQARRGLDHFGIEVEDAETAFDRLRRKLSDRAEWLQRPANAASSPASTDPRSRRQRVRPVAEDHDFLRMAAASRSDGILAAEQRLERDSAGLGWAKDIVANLCVDVSGNLMETCERDGERENYLLPRDHPIGVALAGPAPQGAICVWTFDDGAGPLKQMNAPCDQEVRLRVRSGPTTVAAVDIPLGDGTAQRVVTEIAVRDLLIAGLGDSIAAGEGNPDKAVQLEGGFCFKRFLSGGTNQYFRPSRAGYTGDRSCENSPSNSTSAIDWARHGARWMSPGCRRLRFPAIENCAATWRWPSNSRTSP